MQTMCIILKFSLIADWLVQIMNPDMTPNRMLLDVSVSPNKNYFKKYNKYLIFKYIVDHFILGFSATRRKPPPCYKSLTNFYHIMMY